MDFSYEYFTDFMRVPSKWRPHCGELPKCFLNSYITGPLLGENGYTYKHSNFYSTSLQRQEGVVFSPGSKRLVPLKFKLVVKAVAQVA